MKNKLKYYYAKAYCAFADLQVFHPQIYSVIEVLTISLLILLLILL
jgi:hypothetical protein